MGKSDVKVKQNPQLKQRKLAGGKIALYLEFYYGRTQERRLDASGKPMCYPPGTKMAGKPMYIVNHARKKEELKLYLVSARTAEERQANKDTLQLAEAIRQEREQMMLNDVMGYRVNTHKNDNIISFFDTYVEDYTKKDLRNVRLAINRFKTFIREYRPNCVVKKTAREIDEMQREWEKSHKGVFGKHERNENEYYRFTLKPGQLTNDMVRHFVDYLKANSKGEGAATAYSRFKKVVKYAVEQGVLKSNPCTGVSCQRNDVLTKDVLTSDEVSAMIKCHYAGENKDIRNAFILTLYTGIRFCDVKKLRYSDIDYTNSILTFEQAKTAGHSAASWVNMRLRDDLLQKIIGKPEEHGREKNDLIFNLPSHTMCLKALRRWTARAGIDKHITWHCGRHSFATNILTNGANVKVVAEMLGHSGLRYVEKYTRALDEAKIAAVNSLPPIDL